MGRRRQADGFGAPAEWRGFSLSLTHANLVLRMRILTAMLRTEQGGKERNLGALLQMVPKAWRRCELILVSEFRTSQHWPKYPFANTLNRNTHRTREAASLARIVGLWLKEAKRAHLFSCHFWFWVFFFFDHRRKSFSLRQ